MSLRTGHKLAHYEILEPIGKGGMGEVYRARDGKLGRDVAIKVLREEFSQDTERLRRFQREAKVLASLNHPGIASIYGVEESEGTHYLVLELVPGVTLGDRIARGPISIEEALDIAVKIAEALEEAHEQGFVHRDLKPANVKLTPDGNVIVLDFGLAKALVEETPEADSSMSPTLTRDATRVGVVLGTAAYMSPEQARGKVVDKRADIWAFGCVVYEMLSGRKAFEGETVTDILGAVIHREPDWELIPRSAPSAVRELAVRCLHKDPRRRLRDIGDARNAIDETLAKTKDGGDGRVSGTQKPRVHVLWGLSGLILGSVLASLLEMLLGAGEMPSPVRRVSVNLPSTTIVSRSPILSPQGNRLVYVEVEGETSRLVSRPLDSFRATPIAGTEGAWSAFFSPDGTELGFFTFDGKLKRVSLQGGSSRILAEATDPRGGDWGEDGNILFTPTATSGLVRVPAGGGEPEVLTRPDPAKNERSHRWPEVLPGGRGVLFTTVSGGGGASPYRVEALSLATGERRVLLDPGSGARYVPTGHILYAEGSSLFAVAFDPGALELRGAPTRIAENVSFDPDGFIAFFDVSRSGALAYLPDTPDDRRLVWVSRDGTVEPLPLDPGLYFEPRISPDGRKLAVGIEGSNNEIWLYDLELETMTRFTFSDYHDYAPVWTPDGQRLTFTSMRTGPANLFWKPADGSGPAEAIWSSETDNYATHWSPDGKVLAFLDIRPETGADIGLLQWGEEPKASAFLATPSWEGHARFSPDGKWLAYTSNETGLFEIYVRDIASGGPWQVSTEGGWNPLWGPDGKELLYLELADRIRSVRVETEVGFSVSRPEVLFEIPRVVAGGRPQVDITPNGRRLIAVQRLERPPTIELRLVLGLLHELERIAPPD